LLLSLSVSLQNNSLNATLPWKKNSKRKTITDMRNDGDNTAYIRFEREENSLKYIAKVFNELPRQITKAQYNAIVKSLNNVVWANIDEDEASVISKIISSTLESAE
jgi:hypothetical protein